MTNNGATPSFILKIRASMDGMSRAEQKVCEYIVEHPEEVICFSVSELAKASGVSDATVIRASQKLGSGSYQNLKISLAQDIVTPLQAVNEEISDTDPQSTVLEKVFQSSLHAINSTYNIINVKDIDKAADSMLKARRIGICGLGNSHAIACDLQHKMMRLGLSANAYGDNHLQIMAASTMCDKDVMVCISHSGSSKDVVQAAQVAKDNGATIISITNIGSSPLSRLSHITLQTCSNETKYRVLALSSRIAQMVIIDALYTFMALRAENATEGFYQIEKHLGKTKY